MRLALLLILLAAATGTHAAEKGSVVGKVQPEIRLTDGTVFTKAKVLSYSVENATVMIGEATRNRTVPLDKLPTALREQILAEAGVTPETPRAKVRRVRPTTATPTPPPADKTILPEAPVTTATTPGAPATAMDALLKQASAAAPDEMKFHLMKAFERVGSLTCKVREATQVTGWQRIRVSGEAAFTQWDARQGDHVWRTDKFEVEFSVVEGRSLKAESVSFGGIARAVGEK
jgi:hypothetical protein